MVLPGSFQSKSQLLLPGYLGVSKNWRSDRQRGIFALSKTFFAGILTYFKENAAAQREKARCPGTFGVFRYTLIETAKENALDPYRYLLWVLQNALQPSETDKVWAKKLLPANTPEECYIPQNN